VGAGDVLLAGFLAALVAARGPEDAIRFAVAAATASTLELGAGRVDAREVGRLVADVRVEELERASSGA
jgi:fructose-1-phosphate kinase PfkB-like protein